MCVALIETYRPATQLLISEDSSYEFEIAIDSLERYKAQGNNESSAAWIQEWGETVLYDTREFMNLF